MKVNDFVGCRTLVAGALFLILSVPIRAQESARVVESYRYSFENRFVMDIGLSALPLDAFRKPVQVDLGLSYQFTEFFTWDILNAGYTFFNADTGLKGKIEREASNNASQVTVNEGSLKDLSLRLSSRGYLNLLYSKSNWFNRGIVYHLWQVGAGISHFSIEDGKLISFKERIITADLNLRGRFFINDQMTFNVTAGYSARLPKLSTGGPMGIMNVGLGLSYGF